MSTITKIMIGVMSAAVLGFAGYFFSDRFSDSKPDRLDSPESIVADYKDLLDEAEQLKVAAGENCDNKKDINRQIAALEKKSADLAERKKQWLDNVPKLPDVEPEIANSDNPLGRPGSEVPELTPNVPPLPEIDPKNIITEEVPGSQIPELTPNVPPLPDIDPASIDQADYIPELPEINPGRPGSEVPELTSDVPPLPDINEADIIDPNEHIFQIEDSEQKITNILQALRVLCQDEEKAPVKKAVSDKCSDACQRHKDCAAYTEDTTPADLNDAYNTCMEECATWPKEMIKCINAIDIKNPNDCVGFVQCQLPQHYEEKYLK